MNLNFGQALPLILQLFDGATNKYPSALVRGPAGSLLGTFALSHVGNGEYRYMSYTPESVGIYSAAYIVYDDPARIIESDTYARAQDLFNVTFEVPPVDAGIEFVGELTGELMDDEELVGIIELEEVLSGVIETIEETVL